MSDTGARSYTPTQEPKDTFALTDDAKPGLHHNRRSHMAMRRSKQDSSLLGLSSDTLEEQQLDDSDDGRSLDEKELRRHLADVESSFAPDMGQSTGLEEVRGTDDTYLELADPQTLSRIKKASLLSHSGLSAQSPTAVASDAYNHDHSVDENGFTKPLIPNIGAAATAFSDPDLENSLSSLSESTEQPSTVQDRLWTSTAPSTLLQSHQGSADSRSSRNESKMHAGSGRDGRVSDTMMPSLGSVASFGSAEASSFSTSGKGIHNFVSSIPATRQVADPSTPLPRHFRPEPPTDTVLAARVNSIQVPETVARDFMARNPLSDKRPVSSDGPVLPFSGDRPRRTLTLKEQNGKIDKLTKENFDLKLKIHFLDQALRSHSEEGVQELIDKNVQFQTDLANERKELQTLRRKMREMERKAKEQADLITQLQQAQSIAGSRSENEEATLQSEMHEEILHLRQQLDHSENQLTTLREEMVTEKYEKRKMADHMRSMTGARAEDSSGIRETMDMWQDLLNAETGRREQAEEDLRKLRQELTNLRIERASPVHNRFDARLRRASRPAFGGEDDAASQFTTGDSSVTLVEQLRHENAELRRDLGAQTSMLTSRNRERERLQQEIEDLKMLQRKSDGARSVAGDSIFDRSISRAHNRAPSRVSGHTVVTEAERDNWDRKEGQLRDQNAELKLKYQELDRTHTTHLQYIAALESDFKEMEVELEEATADLKALSAERDEVLQASEELQADYDRLEQEAMVEIDRLEKDLQIHQAHRQKTQSKLDQTNDSYRGLQGELREITQSVMNLEDEKQASIRNIETLEQQLAEMEEELVRWETKCKEYDQKTRKLEVTGESLHSEVSFLREEQEGDKIKIGELENALNAAQQTIQDEQEKLRELEDAILDERQQRDVLENKSKEEVQKVLDDLNNENARGKDEIRKLRRALSAKEVDATSWKTKLDDFEMSFRQALGDGNGTKHSMLEEIDRLQRELDSTANALDRAKLDHADKDRLLRHRDGLLESTSLESRRLSDLLDKERAARKHDLDQFEKASRGQATNLRQIAQYESRILELETGFSHDKRNMAAVEQQFREQLIERNTLLLALWNRLSTLCGTEWSHMHALINGEVPSIDVISRSLPAFQRNVIAAIQYVESVVGGFKARIRSTEKEMMKDYQTLEHNLDMRIRRMDGIERAVHETQARMEEEAKRQQQQQEESRPGVLSRTLSSRTSKNSDEHNRLRSELKLLKAELKFHRQHPSAMAQQLIHQHAQMNPEHVRRMSRDSSSFGPPSPARQIVAQLLRQQQAAVVPLEDSPIDEERPETARTIALSLGQIEPSEQKWVHRLKELERRLRTEREGRLLDRDSARQRLKEGQLENEELKLMLERERLKRESTAMMARAGSSFSMAQNNDDDEPYQRPSAAGEPDMPPHHHQRNDDDD